MKFLTMPVNTAIWRHYDVKSVGNDEYIGGVIISEKTRPPAPSLKSQETKEDRSGQLLYVCLDLQKGTFQGV